MTITDKFLEYVKINTQSDSRSNTVPSTKCQLDLSNLLKKQLDDLGLITKIDKGYVYGHLISNIDKDVDTIGLIAHMDTAPDYSGLNVKPRIIKNWDGKDIKLNEDKTISLDMFPHMKSFINDDIIVTDGNTLLGADDKAGISIIMEVIEYLVNNKDIKHGDIKVCFTPDEEIGKGADCFDIEYFNADYAYTLDGSACNELCYETFNAYEVIVNIKGVSIHPGSAKGKLINAISLANKFDNMLPTFDRPEYTEKAEGFNHLHFINGSAENCKLEYIVRNHSKEIIMKQLDDFNRIKEYINNDLGYDAIDIETNMQYQNMYELLHDKNHILDLAKNAIKDIGLDLEIESARGGTDGSRLTFMGLPTPNLGTGGTNFHGPYEACSINQMETMVKVVLKMIESIIKGN